MKTTNVQCTSKGAFPLTLISDRLKEDVEANDDPSPTRDPTGIAQAGWKEEEGVEDRSELRKEIETETGMCVLCAHDCRMVSVIYRMNLLSPGAHEPPKAAKKCRTQHVRPSRSSSPSHVPKFYFIQQEAVA